MNDKDIIKSLEEIKLRNKRVELDKGWETSKTRTISICILIYIVVLVFNAFVNTSGNIYLNALIPIIGFYLSTRSLAIIKKIWIKLLKK